MPEPPDAAISRHAPDHPEGGSLLCCALVGVQGCQPLAEVDAGAERTPRAGHNDDPYVIVRVGETTIEDRADLEYALSTQYKPGETVPVTVIRDGRQMTAQVRLGDRPTSQPQR